MAEIKVNPTRMELKKLKIRYITARRGHKLLKDKRDGLMKKFLEVVREDKDLRESIELKLASVYRGLSVAGAVSSPQMMREALILPKKEGNLNIHYKNVMSVVVPTFDFKISLAAGNSPSDEGAAGAHSSVAGSSAAASSGAGDGMNYGMAFTSGELDASLEELSEILGDLIRLAELEKTAQLLALEIEKTRRRVNALEYIMIPQLQVGIKSITMKLDENERGNLTRLMKVKDMMLAKAHGYDTRE